MKQKSWKPLSPLVIVFILLNALFISGRSFLERWNADQSVLIIGNLIIFLVCLTSYFISAKALSSPNPQATVRAMYGGFLVKLFVCGLAAVIYILSVKKDVNKPALFTCMGLYLVYSFIEVSLLTKMTKKKNG